MNATPPQGSWQDGFRRQVERLEGLPLRASSVRAALNSMSDGSQAFSDVPSENSRSLTPFEIDPGWVLARVRTRGAFDPLDAIIERDWWSTTSGALSATEALTRLWKHSVAVSLAARRLAREAGDDQVELITRAGFLCSLGYWAVAAIEPSWLTAWFAERDPKARRALEGSRLGVDITKLGRWLAERWGCGRFLADAAWLHADRDRGINAVAGDPRRLGFIQEAYAIAERSPWSLMAPEVRELANSDSRLRLLIAEVQIHCGGPFVETDATTHELKLSRSNAGLRKQLARSEAEASTRGDLIRALGESVPTESPETWSERAGLAFCTPPGVATARVVWKGPGAQPSPTQEPSANDRSPACKFELSDRGEPTADIELWGDFKDDSTLSQIEGVLPAWQAWAALLAGRTDLELRLDEAVRVYRDHVETEEPRLRRSKIDSLAEFAAGAGHELNNPLAVIVGRAQLLMGKEQEPTSIRSLGAILTQAKRTHRILRDLMFVARTPEPRPRFCSPDELVRASVREFRPEAEARGVRLQAEETTGLRVWTDPDAFRHVLDVLIRNALESTPKGGNVQIRLEGDAESLRWSVRDSGRGITLEEGQHLFDPFFCGRQAGRGLGLGLSRAAKIVSQAGGELQWSSTPGHGTLFRVHLPLQAPPKSPTAEPERSGLEAKGDA